MNQQLLPLEGRVRVSLSWGVLYGQEVPEPDFVQAISQLPVGQLLPGLITLLQYGDARHHQPTRNWTVESVIFFPPRKRAVLQNGCLGKAIGYFSRSGNCCLLSNSSAHLVPGTRVNLKSAMISSSTSC